MKNTPEMPSVRPCPFDPPAEYRNIRAEAPVAQFRTPRGNLAWLITRFDDIKQVLTDPRFSSDPTRPGFPSYLTGDILPPPGYFLLMDSPDHHRLRSVIVQELKGARLEELRPKMQAIVDAQVERMLQMTPPVDLIQVFALPVASLIICDLLGVPYQDHSFVQDRTDTILDRSRTPKEQEAAAIELMMYFDRIVTEKEQHPENDLIGRLIQDPARSSKINHAELVGLAALILLSAYDTMVQVIGLGTLTLLNHPEQVQDILSSPVLIDKLTDELVRYLTVNHAGLPRVATEDVVVGGQTIRAGEGVVVMLNSGNRDEEAFTLPDEFNVHRSTRDHVGFGHGLHKCIGAHYARMELGIVFSSLFRQVHGLQVTVPTHELEFRDEMVLYGVKQLPVSWDLRAKPVQIQENTEGAAPEAKGCPMHAGGQHV
ncbi:cytochrome P450 [Deinococcus cellulosilyticus]|uniref:Cytochrome P450 n=1 Tax=Deinococcus cellulosilyticus (strain DSM 18568 / NBRC 106333 / KACC 11606 / 5516J-15) TaxID=1223518 RepID=A0A511N342_DEIC1|nr:cytochrome P450 [Deinococcus cellulosilyticus]GEM46878.1 cytochrome P450 [Deinococcus cellulosilyticus NBRC 106333 = KACC 11606]